MSTIAEATSVLAAAGVPSARHDAIALARHLLGGASAVDLNGRGLGSDYEVLVARRAAREPLQYIVGSAPFRHLEVLVGPGVFVPRPETEVLAGWVIDAVTSQQRPVVVDLCTGPGTVALAVASEVPHAVVHGVDVDADALEWARRNARAADLRIAWHHGDVAVALLDLDRTVDAVVANPPYIPRSSADAVDPEARDYEPVHALFADDGGLAVIRSVINVAARLLRPGGVLAVEHGEDQGVVVPELVAATDAYTEVEDHRDLAGRDRFTTARRASR